MQTAVFAELAKINAKAAIKEHAVIAHPYQETQPDKRPAFKFKLIIIVIAVIMRELMAFNAETDGIAERMIGKGPQNGLSSLGCRKSRQAKQIAIAVQNKINIGRSVI